MNGKKKKKQLRHFRPLTRAALLRALLNDKWDYRTSKGLAKELRVPEKEIKKHLESDPEIRKSFMKDRFGRSLYTLKKKKSVWADIKTVFRAINSAKLGS